MKKLTKEDVIGLIKSQKTHATLCSLQEDFNVYGVHIHWVAGQTNYGFDVEFEIPLEEDSGDSYPEITDTFLEKYFKFDPWLHQPFLGNKSDKEVFTWNVSCSSKQSEIHLAYHFSSVGDIFTGYRFSGSIVKIVEGINNSNQKYKEFVLETSDGQKSEFVIL